MMEEVHVLPVIDSATVQNIVDQRRLAEIVDKLGICLDVQGKDEV